MVTLQNFIHRLPMLETPCTSQAQGLHPHTPKQPFCTAYYTAAQESNAQLISFECPHSTISSTDSNVRATLYSVINNTTWKYFHWNEGLRNIFVMLCKRQKAHPQLARALDQTRVINRLTVFCLPTDSARTNCVFNARFCLNTLFCSVKYKFHSHR